MEEETNYLTELLSEKESLDPSFVHCMRLLTTEINRVQSGGSLTDDDNVKNGVKPDIGEDEEIPEGGSRPHRERRDHRQWRRPPPLPVEEGKLYKPVKLSEKVFIPHKDHPKFNFVGKLLGPRGNTFKRLQNSTGTKMSILGKGSMRDKEKEDELRATEDAKYAHLADELHVLIEVEAPPGQAHARLGIAIEEIKKYLIPEMNDEIHQEQMREMAIINSFEDKNNNQGQLPGPPGPQGPQGPPSQPPPQGRGRARPPPPVPAPPHHPHTIHIPVQRPGPHPLGMRPRGVHLSAAARSVARLPPSPTLAQAAPRSQAPHIGDHYLHGMQTVLIPNSMDMPHHRGGGVHLNESYDPAYAAYEAAYAEAEEVQYYDYGQRVAQGDIYETAYPAPVRLPATTYKTPPLRSSKKIIREAAFPY